MSKSSVIDTFLEVSNVYYQHIIDTFDWFERRYDVPVKVDEDEMMKEILSWVGKSTRTYDEHTSIELNSADRFALIATSCRMNHDEIVDTRRHEHSIVTAFIKHCTQIEYRVANNKPRDILGTSTGNELRNYTTHKYERSLYEMIVGDEDQWNPLILLEGFETNSSLIFPVRRLIMKVILSIDHLRQMIEGELHHQLTLMSAFSKVEHAIVYEAQPIRRESLEERPVFLLTKPIQEFLESLSHGTPRTIASEYFAEQILTMAN